MLIRRLGLRLRVTVAFVTLTLVLSSAAAVAVWLLVTHYLVSRERTVAVTAARVTAGSVGRGLADRGATVPEVLDRAAVRQTAVSLLSYHGEWYTTSPQRGPEVLPGPLVRRVRSGTPATQRIRVGSHLMLAVGVPLADHGAYVRLSDLDELQRTLGVLRTTLVLATLLLGLAASGVGWFASRVALHPLRELTRVAAAAARGERGARLAGAGDPDLDGLVTSFNRTTEALERRVEADARFAGDVSHELRTPLTTMVNAVQLIQNRERQLPESVREPLSLLAEELDRFSRLVVDLIEMSRVDGRARMRLEPVRVADTVREAADAAAGRRLTTVDADAAQVSLAADKNRLARALTNLVENAEQHGGGCLGVRVSASGEEVRVEVDDAGPGIPESLRERVFERFFRGIDGSVASNGLGLAITARQVQEHGGRVLATERPGGGSRFVVLLPRERR